MKYLRKLLSVMLLLTTTMLLSGYGRRVQSVAFYKNTSRGSRYGIRIERYIILYCKGNVVENMAYDISYDLSEDKGGDEKITIKSLNKLVMKYQSMEGVDAIGSATDGKYVISLDLAIKKEILDTLKEDFLLDVASDSLEEMRVLLAAQDFMEVEQ